MLPHCLRAQSSPLRVVGTLDLLCRNNFDNQVCSNGGSQDYREERRKNHLFLLIFFRFFNKKNTSHRAKKQVRRASYSKALFMPKLNALWPNILDFASLLNETDNEQIQTQADHEYIALPKRLQRTK